MFIITCQIIKFYTQHSREGLGPIQPTIKYGKKIGPILLQPKLLELFLDKDVTNLSKS